MIKNATHLVVMNENEIKRLKKYNFKGEIISSFHPIYDIDFNSDRIELTLVKNNLVIELELDDFLRLFHEVSSIISNQEYLKN